MIKIYCTKIDELDTPFIVERLLECVNTQRRDKILRCHNEKDKLRSLAAGLLLRYALEQEGLIYAETEILISDMGKPFLRSQKQLYFSISHAEDVAACAIADTDLGIDIESVVRMQMQYADAQKRQRLLNKIATPFEMNYIASLPEEQYAEGLLRIWTGKESYGKFQGIGIQMNMKECEVIDTTNIYADWMDENKKYFLSLYTAKQVEKQPETHWISVAKEYSK